ncbi:MAG: hypothetical protein ABIJ57_01060 [Pseudomonadota bacterium]
MGHIEITFNDGTKQKEFHVGFRITKERLLCIEKGRYSPSLFINMDTVKLFQEVEND